VWTLNHRKLQTVCVYLWPKVADARTLVSDSGIDASQIAWDEPPGLRWQSILFEAEKQGSLPTLIPILLLRYPGNADLQAACAPWNGGSAGGNLPAAMMEAVMEAVMVPIVVPEEFATIAADNAIATVDSLRMEVAALRREFDELLAWRHLISTVSTPNMAVPLDE